MVTKKTDSKKQPADVPVKSLVTKLYGLMVKEGLQEITWEEEKEFKLKLRRKGEQFMAAVAVGNAVAGKKEEKKEIIDTARYIRSPMNGVFYTASSPGAEPFVKENDNITVGATVCIIEAMKLMNEVQVERSCRIIKILVENGSPVKVTQPLFEVENL